MLDWSIFFALFSATFLDLIKFAIDVPTGIDSGYAGYSIASDSQAQWNAAGSQIYLVGVGVRRFS